MIAVGARAVAVAVHSVLLTGSTETCLFSYKFFVEPVEAFGDVTSRNIVASF